MEVLSELVACRVIPVEIMLPIEARPTVDRAAKRGRKPDCAQQRLASRGRRRERARQGDIEGLQTGIGVRRRQPVW